MLTPIEQPTAPHSPDVPDLLRPMVVAIDRSEESRAAVVAAAQLAAATGAAVHVVHVRRSIPTGAITAAEYEEPGQAMDLVDAAIAQLRAHGVAATGEVHDIRTGSIADAVVAVVANERPGMLVIGCRCRHQLGALVFGHTAEQLIHQSPCPVLLVR